MSAVLLVALGGAVGAVIRHALARSMTTTFPWAILIANVAGSFLLGVLVGWATAEVVLLLGLGLAGALTTYSTMAADAWLSAETGRRREAALIVTLTVLGSLTAVTLGIAASGWIQAATGG
ncbi:MAG: CrcB family protein [Mobilicoccus sp.]|nr:CrcB family protein [Mobilicoccus sp.]